MRSPNHLYYIRRLNFCKLLLGLRKARPFLLQFLARFSPSRTRGLFPRLKGTNKKRHKLCLHLLILSDYKIFGKSGCVSFELVLCADFGKWGVVALADVPKRFALAWEANAHTSSLVFNFLIRFYI